MTLVEQMPHKRPNLIFMLIFPSLFVGTGQQSDPKPSPSQQAVLPFIYIHLPYGNPYGFDINVWIAIFNDHEQTCQGKKKLRSLQCLFQKPRILIQISFYAPTSQQLPVTVKRICRFEDLTILIRLVSYLTNTGTVVVGIMRNPSPNRLEHAILKFGLACS